MSLTFPLSLITIQLRKTVSCEKRNGFNCWSIRYNISSQFWCGKRVSLSVAERTKACRSMLCHSSFDLVSWNFLPWFQVRITPTLPQLYHHLSLVPPIKWQGSDKAPERGRGFILEVNQTSLCLLLSPTPLPVCLLSCLPAYQSTFLASVSVCQGCLSSCLSVTPVCVSTCPLTRLSSSLPVFVLDHVCLPAFISPSVSVQPDLTVVSGLFQSVTSWLTDLWAD